MEFAKLGAAGIPLLFEFNKQICGLFFVMAALYYGPLYVTINGNFSELSGDLTLEDLQDMIPTISGPGMNSIGVFFYDPTTDSGIRYIEDSDGPDFSSL